MSPDADGVWARRSTMKWHRLLSVLALAAAAPAIAQQTPQAPQPFAVGPPLGVTAEGKTTPMSSNVKVFGSVVSAESCTFDAKRGLILTINRGAAQNEVPNDAWVSFHNSDGSVHTPRWIGVNRNGLVLNQPFGSAIHDDVLYLADSDGATADGAKRVSVVRKFDMTSGEPKGSITVADSPWFNDIAVAKDGTIYASQTGTADGATPMRIYKVTADGQASVFHEGAPLNLPNGVEVDKDGNIIVVNVGDDAVLTFAPDAKITKTEKAALAGSDGLVLMPDGAKYVSSVRLGGVSRIKPGKTAELIATGIPNAASMCYDSKAKQLVSPLNANNALAFVKLK
jgi:hypothetical protein